MASQKVLEIHQEMLLHTDETVIANSDQLQENIVLWQYHESEARKKVASVCWNMKGKRREEWEKWRVQREWGKWRVKKEWDKWRVKREVRDNTR